MVSFVATFIKGDNFDALQDILWSNYVFTVLKMRLQTEEGSMFCLPIFCRYFLQISYASHFSFSLMLVGGLVSSMILDSPVSL